MFYKNTRGRKNSLRQIGKSAVATIALIAGGGAALAQPAASPVTRAAPEKSPVPVLNKAQIDAYLATPDKVVFIDVRRPDELASIGGLPAYLNIQGSELDRFLAYIPRDRQIVTISNHAHRAIAAGAVLLGKGFTVVGAIGVQDYAAEGGVLYGQKFVTPAIAGVVAANTRVEVIREGFDGTEGPVVVADGSILFTENRADRIVRVAPDGGISTFLEKAGSPNALAVTGKGEIVAVQTAPSAVAIVSPSRTVLASAFRGKPFVRPNDLALAKAGDIYFSDPGAAQQAAQSATPPATPPKTGLYWADRKHKVSLIADDILRPNGVALSPDEKTLYVANTAGEYLIAFTIRPDGSLVDRRDFAKLAGFKQAPTGPTSGADGIAVDVAGRVYVATLTGVQIFSPEGGSLGTIALPKQPQNLAFGGVDRSRLYVVGRGSVYRIATQTRGVDRPGK